MCIGWRAAGVRGRRRGGGRPAHAGQDRARHRVRRRARPLRAARAAHPGEEYSGILGQLCCSTSPNSQPPEHYGAPSALLGSGTAVLQLHVLLLLLQPPPPPLLLLLLLLTAGSAGWQL